MKKVFGNKKLILTIAILVTLLVVGATGTYAWYYWSSSDEDSTKIVTSVGAATVMYAGGADMKEQKLRPVGNKNQGIVKEINVKVSANATGNVSLNLYLDINTLDDGLKHESFKYEIWKGQTLLKNGNFSQEYLNSNLVTCEKNNTDHIVLVEDDTVGKKTSTYTMYLWIDGENFTNPNTMMNSKFSFKLHADGTGAISDNDVTDITGSFADYIVGLYNNPTLTHVFSNVGETQVAYMFLDESETWGLVNDGLDIEGNQVDNIIYGTEKGNLRYFGADPHNYIDIGDRDLFGQMILYRIIGLFRDVELEDGSKQDLVKIVRAYTVGQYSWDNKSSGIGSSVSNNGSNNWADARLMMVLNPGYDTFSASNPLLDSKGKVIYGVEGSLYWNRKSGSCYTGGANHVDRLESCNLEFYGLSPDVHDKIETVVWPLGGYNNINVYASDMYKFERGNAVYSGRQSLWTGKIALPYASDYGFASNFEKCNTTFNNYKNEECYGSNWLYTTYGERIWTLTPSSTSSSYGALIYSNGSIINGLINVGYHEIRPTFYLTADIPFWYFGDGTRENPYRL